MGAKKYVTQILVLFSAVSRTIIECMLNAAKHWNRCNDGNSSNSFVCRWMCVTQPLKNSVHPKKCVKLNLNWTGYLFVGPVKWMKMQWSCLKWRELSWNHMHNTIENGYVIVFSLFISIKWDTSSLVFTNHSKLWHIMMLSMELYLNANRKCT